MRPVEVHWRLFSLEEINKGEGTVDWENGRTTAALRTLALVRRQHGEEAVDRLYDTLAEARFKQEKALNEPGVIESALEAAGLDRGLRERALADSSTKDEVLREHEGIVAKDGAFGVPTVVLDNGDGPGIFGPVIGSVPQGEAAGELWDHVVWLTRQTDFYELKRSRPRRH